MKSSTRILLMQKRLLTPVFLGSRLALWLDSLDSRTITFNGSTASDWRDKSTNRYIFSQSTAANQPTYVANGLNNLPALRFSGNQGLSGTIPILENQRNITFFGVSSITKRDRDEAVGFASGGTINPTSGIRWGLFGNGYSSTYGLGWGGTNASIRLGNGLLLPVSTPFQSSYMKTASNWNIFLNGALISGLIADNSFPTGTFNAHIGAESSNFVYSVSALYSEFIIMTGIFSIYERQRLEGYLAHKWRLTANLPNNHPFKLRPPYM